MSAPVVVPTIFRKDARRGTGKSPQSFLTAGPA
jgi:hypothetical protein